MPAGARQAPVAADHDALLEAAPPAAPTARGPAAWWLLRVVLPALVTAAAVGQVALSELDPPCSPADPCTWPLRQAPLDGLDVGSLVLAWVVPVVGLPLSAAAALLLAATSPEDLTPLLSAALALRVAAGAAGGVVAARARRRGRGATTVLRALPVRGREVLAHRGPTGADLLAASALAAAVALTGWWVAQERELADHLAAARPAVVEVTAVDDLDWLVEVAVPGAGTAVLDDTYEPRDFVPGDRVPALVDTSGPRPWVSLDGEPEEVTGWLVLAVAALLVGVALGAGRARVVARRRRLLRHGGPVHRTRSLPDESGSAVLLPDLGLRLPLARTSPVDDVLEDVGLARTGVWADTAVRRPAPQDGASDDAAREEVGFARAWRGEDGEGEEEDDAPLVEPTVLVGDARPGGVALAVTADLVLVPCAALAPMSPRDRAWAALVADVERPGAAAHPAPRRQGAPGRREDPGPADLDRHGLPGHPAVPLPGSGPLLSPAGRRERVALALPGRRRLWALAVLLLPAAVWLSLDPTVAPGAAGLLDVLSPLAALGVPAVLGLAASRTAASFDEDGLVVRVRGLRRRVPWSEVVGTRVVGQDVVLALGLDGDGDVDAVGGRPPRDLPVERAAGLAERWRRDAVRRPARQEGARPDPVVALAAAGLVGAAVVLAVRHLLL